MNGKDKNERRGEYLEIALQLAQDSNYMQVTPDAIAAFAGVSVGSVYYALGTLTDMRDCIVRKAVETENVTVVAQALGLQHSAALEAPQLLKARAVKLIGTL